jgi:hypothetical protein
VRPRALAIVLVLAAACGDDDESPARGRFRAVGTMIHDGLAGDDRAAWATELEILRSQRLLEHAVEDLRLPTERVDEVRRGLRAKRRADSRVLEVAVSSDDRELAHAACNGVLDAYLERSVGMRVEDAARSEKALAAELDRLRADITASASDGGPEDPAAVARYEKALARYQEVTLARTELRSDVRLLDRCTVFERR